MVTCWLPVTLHVPDPGTGRKERRSLPTSAIVSAGAGCPNAFRSVSGRAGQAARRAGRHVDIDGVAQPVTTDGDGWIRHSDPTDARKATLTFETGEVYRIDLAHLPPHDSIEGVRCRLRNLVPE